MTGHLKISPADVSGLARDWQGNQDLQVGGAPPEGQPRWPSQQAAHDYHRSVTSFSQGLGQEFDEFGNALDITGQRHLAQDQGARQELAKGVDLAGVAALIKAFTDPVTQIGGQMMNSVGQATSAAGSVFGQALNPAMTAALKPPAVTSSGAIGAAAPTGGSVAGSAPITSPSAGHAPPRLPNSQLTEQPVALHDPETTTGSRTSGGVGGMPVGLRPTTGAFGMTVKPTTYRIQTGKEKTRADETGS